MTSDFGWCTFGSYCKILFKLVSKTQMSFNSFYCKMLNLSKETLCSYVINSYARYVNSYIDKRLLESLDKDQMHE